MKEIKTATVSQLIKALITIRNEHGDLPVLLASDVEGNMYSTVNVQDLYGLDDENGFLILYPYEEGVDI